MPLSLSTPLVFTLGALGAGAPLSLLLSVRLRKAERRHAHLKLALAAHERAAADIHDASLQAMQGLMLCFHNIGQRLPADNAERAAIDRLLDQGDAVIANLNQRMHPPPRQ